MAQGLSRRIAVKTGLGIPYSLFLALLCNLVLDFMQTGGNAERLVNYTLGSAAAVTLLNSVTIWMILLLLWGITGRLSVATYVLLIVTIVIGYANYLKLTLRREPLYPSDLGFASSPGFLTQMVGVSGVLMILVLFLALGLVVFLTARIVNRRLPRARRREQPGAWWTTIAGRILGGSLALVFLIYAASFNATDNRLRAAYESSGADWAFWFQELNYRSNGFVGGVLYNLDVPAMQKPPGYGPKEMNRLVAHYTARAKAISERRNGPPAADQPNIVLILSESFSDPARLDGPEFVADPIPHTRHLMDTTTSGTMLAQLFGGGTANMEFETMTGMSLSQFEPQMNTPYQMLVPDYQDFPSVVGYLKNQGYAATAIHPYMTSMYKREAVYPVLGFDRFVGQDDMDRADKLERSDFISDDAAFRQTEFEMDSSAKPLLVNLVTMQNHVPMANSYDNPLEVEGVSGDPKDQVENYGRGLEYTDQALSEYLTRLQKSDEDTAVIFYGDHLPAIWPTPVYEHNGYLRMRQTPYLYWANFDLPQRQTPPLTSPIYFLPNLFDLLGHEIPPYYALLLALQDEIPAMEQGEYFDGSGQPVTEDEFTPRARRLLDDYRMVQYDLSIGRRYSEADLFYPQSTP